MIGKFKAKPHLSKLSGVYGLSAAFFFFTIGHYVATEEMVLMIPSFVPFRTELVYLTGLLELSLAIGLLIPRHRHIVGLLCIAVFVGFFPSNIYAAINHTGMGGHVWGPEYLLIRTPLQIILITWTYFFAVRQVNKP